MRAQRLTEAAEWLLRLNEESRTGEDITQWVEWCHAHPENAAAFESLQQDWQELDALKSGANIGAASLGRGPWWRMKSMPSVCRRIAAAAAGALVAGALFYGVGRVPPPVKQVTAAMTNKAATLPDGSSIILGAGTLVKVDFDLSARRLNLSEGEAYFKVERDMQRPFVVHAGQIDVTAIGTAFNVRHEKEQIIVTVEEGTVRIASAADSWHAQAGHQLKYSLQSATAALASVDPRAALKWRDGELAYEWQPLSAVLTDINRYSPRHIALADASLATLRFTGTVFTDSIEDWLKAIESAYPVRVEWNEKGEIALHAATSVPK